MAYRTAGSEKQEVGIETELHREKPKLAEDRSEGMQVKNEREGVLDDSLNCHCSLYLTFSRCVVHAVGGSRRLKGPIACGTGADSLLFTSLCHLTILSLKCRYGVYV